MNLSIGIVGLPNVGKSTLFKILTKQEVNIANYPFATIEPNVGIVAVPDERLNKLAKLSASKKIVPAVVKFYDIAGLVKGAYQGEGLGNQFLAHIRETSAIVQVVRIFPSNEIIHVEKGVDPIRDIEIINTELVLKDLETVDKRLIKVEVDVRGRKKEAIEEKAVLDKAKKILEAGDPLFSKGADSKNSFIKSLGLLTAKPQIYLLNGEEKDIAADLKNKIKSLNADFLALDLIKEENISELIKRAYQILNLISFFTTGEDETRAWTIEGGAKAPKAAGVIHTDFEKKFIRAEVINWQKLLETDGWTKAKEKGLIRLEGKDYLVKDGDVMVIRHG